MISQLRAQVSHDACDALRAMLCEWPSARSLLLSEQERSAALYQMARAEYQWWSESIAAGVGR